MNTSVEVFLVLTKPRHPFFSIAKRTSFVPAAAMAYTDLASLKGLVRPADYGSGVEYASGVINSIFPNTKIGLQLGLWLNGTYGCQQIINGEMDQQMNKLRKYLTFTNASAVFLRIGYEFDNPFFGYSDNATAYILAFQRIVDYMRDHLNEDRLDKTFFVWHSWAAPRAGNLTLEDFYPSDDYVDWIGVSVFRQVYPWKSNWGNGYVDWGGSVKDIEEVLDFAQKRDKPTMIAESTPFGGINMETADTIKYNETDPWDRWFGKVLTLIEKYDIDMFSYINCDWDKQNMWRGVGFGDTRLSTNAEVMDRWFGNIIRSDGNQKFLMGNSICREEEEVASPKGSVFAADMPFFIPVILLVIAVFIFGNVYSKSRSDRRERRALNERTPLNNTTNV